MTFAVPEKLIAHQFINLAEAGHPPILLHPKTKAVLAMKWLQSKMLESKQSPAKRMAAVYGDMENTKAVQTLVKSLDVDSDLEALGRRYNLFLDPAREHSAKGLGDLWSWLEAVHDSVFCIFTSEKGYHYPVAGYRSGGKRGLKPHIYLFLPGIGELKGFKAGDFRSKRMKINETIVLKDDEIVSYKGYATRFLSWKETLNEPDDGPTPEAVDLAQSTTGAGSGATLGRVVVEGGSVAVAGLARNLEQS